MNKLEECLYKWKHSLQNHIWAWNFEFIWPSALFSRFYCTLVKFGLNPVEKSLEALQMYLYKRILCIPWVQRVTNEKMLSRVGKQKELLLTVKQQKTNYIGHIMRGEKNEFLRLIIKGKIQEKRSVGSSYHLQRCSIQDHVSNLDCQPSCRDGDFRRRRINLKHVIKTYWCY